MPGGFRLRGGGFEGLGFYRRRGLAAARGVKGAARWERKWAGGLRLIGTCLAMGERRRRFVLWWGLNRGLRPLRERERES